MTFSSKLFLNNSLEHAESTLLGKLEASIRIMPLHINNQLKSAESLARFVGVNIRSGKSLRRVVSILCKIKRKSSGVEGFRVSCAGRIRGVEMAKTYSRGLGKTPTSVSSKKVDYYRTHVITKYGIIGIKVWICFS